MIALSVAKLKMFSPERINGPKFYEWLFGPPGPKKISRLSRNGPQDKCCPILVPRAAILVANATDREIWQYEVLKVCGY